MPVADGTAVGAAVGVVVCTVEAAGVVAVFVVVLGVTTTGADVVPVDVTDVLLNTVGAEPFPSVEANGVVAPVFGVQILTRSEQSGTAGKVEPPLDIEERIRFI